MSGIFDLGEFFNECSNSKWFMLLGQSLESAKRMIVLEESGKKISPAENEELRETLGLNFPVTRTIPDQGMTEVYPKIFILNAPDEHFYMMCPIGTGIYGPENFEPQDAIQLINEEISAVTGVLFAPGIESEPVVSRDPVILIP